MGDRLLAVLLATILFASAIALCMSWHQPGHVGRYDYMGMVARDRDLLTAEQQRVLVREGHVTVTLAGREYTFYNNEEMRPYLNEGGAL